MMAPCGLIENYLATLTSYSYHVNFPVLIWSEIIERGFIITEIKIKGFLKLQLIVWDFNGKRVLD